MEFFFAVFFLLFYYLRPQDWVPGLIGLGLVKPIIITWLGVVVAGRSLSSPLSGVMRTPHDWVILSYFIYVVWTAPEMMTALTGFLSLVAFYALTVQSVNSWPRLYSYLKWWTIALAILALLGVLVPLGIDPTGGKELTDFFQGRVSLGTWTHNNPNFLAHSVVVAIPASYFLFFWRGTPLGKWVLFPMISGVAFWCVYLTESKGAFVSGGILVASLYIVGRPKIVQIVTIIIASTMGVGALSFLPRMSQMSDLRSDPGVQGRLLAWEQARQVGQVNATGVGWQQFTAFIEWREGDQVLIVSKATHSSYVQVFADLGSYGLFLYMAGLWCVTRTLLRFRPANVLEDRCRRLIWLILLSTLSSGWMLNHEYHVEYFLLVAAGAALHRLVKARELGLVTNDGSESPNSEQPGYPVLEALPEAEPLTDMTVANEAVTTKMGDDVIPAKPLWNKFGILDVGICIGLTWLTLWVWDYILANI